MLYNNLPDYTRRRAPETGRRPGMPSALPKSFSGRRTALRQTGQPRRSTDSYQMRAMRPQPPAVRTVTPDWSRPQQRQPLFSKPKFASIKPSFKKPSIIKPAFKMPEFKLPTIKKPELNLSAFIHRPRALAAMVVVALFGLSLLTGIFPPASITQAFAGLTTSEAEKAEDARKVQMDAYAAEVSKIIAAHDAKDVAVTTIDLSDSMTLTLGDQGTFTAASTAKLLTAVTLLTEVEAGRLSMNKYIAGVRAGDLLERLIVKSDNNAWQVLNDYLTHGVLEAYATQLGWSKYNSDINSLRPIDMANLAAKLYKGELLNAANTELLLAYMMDSTKQDYIVTNVPVSGYTVYHKAGWLDGLMHDVAIIKGAEKTIVLAIYTFSGDAKVSGDTFENQELFAEITSATLKTYFPPSAASGQ